jgi:hypothetical protein
MYISSLLRWFYQSPEGKLFFPEENVEDNTDNTDNTDDTDDFDTDNDSGDENDDTKDDDDKDKDDNTDDDLDIKDDDEEKDDKEESTEEDEDTEEEDTDADSDSEVVTRWTDLKAKYPNIGKDFPDIKNALFRNEAFSEVFGSVKDAETAKGRADTLANIEEDLFVKRDPTELLKTISKNDKEVFSDVAFKILPFIQETDKELYFELAALPIKQLVRSALSKGRDDKGNLTNLGKAALVMHQYFFDNQDVNSKVKAEGGEKKTESEAEKEYKKRLAELEGGKQQEFTNSVDQSYVKNMDNYIRESLDKDDRLSDFLKSTLTEKILLSIREKLSKDSRYLNTLESLNKQARASGYTKDFKSRIVNTALVRAKSLVPELRKELVAKALNMKKKVNTENKDNREKKQDKTPNNKQKFRNNNNNSNAKPDKSKSDLDILKEA